jgi:hypothetical protein
MAAFPGRSHYFRTMLSAGEAPLSLEDAMQRNMSVSSASALRRYQRSQELRFPPDLSASVLNQAGRLSGQTGYK